MKKINERIEYSVKFAQGPNWYKIINSSMQCPPDWAKSDNGIDEVLNYLLSNYGRPEDGFLVIETGDLKWTVIFNPTDKDMIDSGFVPVCDGE